MSSIRNRGAITGSLSSTGSIQGELSSRGNVAGTLMYTFLKGASAYEVAVANGFVGSVTEWLESLGVHVTVVEDSDDAYILKFKTSDTIIVTPNLKANFADMSADDIIRALGYTPVDSDDVVAHRTIGTLKIGSYSFDGSEDVTIKVYDGSEEGD